LLLAKQEVTYGTDPAPVATANTIAITRQGVNFSPGFDHLTRMILDGTISKVSGLNAMPEVSLSFEVELRGNRTDGVAADISKGDSAHAVEVDCLLQACDLSPTYTAETTLGARNGQVVYKPIVPVDEGKSVTFYFYSGLKRHKILGAKGTVKLSTEAGKFGKLMFEFRGLYVAVTDAGIPGTITWLDTKPPLSSSGSVDSFTPVFTKLDVDLGNKLSRRDDANSANGVKGFLITDRDSNLTIDPESVAEATHPIWADLAGGAQRQISGLSGAQTGNIIALTFSCVSKGVSYGDRSGIRTQSIDYSIERSNISDSPGAEFQLAFG
jgi:hypothetical protein